MTTELVTDALTMAWFRRRPAASARVRLAVSESVRKTRTAQYAILFCDGTTIN
jgi:hypothetical protein